VIVRKCVWFRSVELLANLLKHGFAYSWTRPLASSGSVRFTRFGHSSDATELNWDSEQIQNRTISVQFSSVQFSLFALQTH